MGRKSLREGFTLIELLITIGIIMILASILTPALLRARESARRSSCLFNIRSIGQAMHIYASENDDKFPYFPTVNEVFGNLYNKQSFNDNKVYVCPNRRRQEPPTYDPNNHSFTIDSESNYATGDQIISYCLVASVDGANGDAAVNPLITDPQENALLIEDPRSDNSGETANFSDLDNHGKDGCNIFTIGGQGKWFKGKRTAAVDINNGSRGTCSLPIIKKIDGEEDWDLTDNSSEADGYIIYPDDGA